MIVYAVYVVTDDGRTILSENFQSTEEIPNEILLGGLLTAIQFMADEMTKQTFEIKSIIAEGISFHIKSFGFIRIVIATNDPEPPENIINNLGLRFMNRYGDVVSQNDFNLDIFTPFKEIILEILKDTIGFDESKTLKPIKRLDTSEIFKLPHNVHSTALALLALEQATAKAISQESGEEIYHTKKSLKILHEMGYLGKKREKGKIYYFCVV
ncbi:MAG: hypothetical protein ACFE95_06515 [Candidatus Hodarchaeota archaeon]